MCLFCRTQRKIFWRKFVIRLFWGTIDFHSRNKKYYGSQWCPRTALFPTFFRISSFVFTAEWMVHEHHGVCFLSQSTVSVYLCCPALNWKAARRLCICATMSWSSLKTCRPSSSVTGICWTCGDTGRSTTGSCLREERAVVTVSMAIKQGKLFDKILKI